MPDMSETDKEQAKRRLVRVSADEPLPESMVVYTRHVGTFEEEFLRSLKDYKLTREG